MVFNESLYKQLTDKELEIIQDEAFKYPATTASFLERIKETGNIYQLRLGDVWELAKLVDCTNGGSIDLFKMTNRFL